MARGMVMLDLLNDIAVAAEEAPSVEAAIAASMDRLCDLARWSGGVLLLPNEAEPGEHVPSATWRAAPDAEAVPCEARIRRGDGLIGRVLEDGRATWAGGAAGAEALRQLGVRDPEARAVFAFPVSSEGVTLGVIAFYGAHSTPPPPTLRRLMGHVGRLLGRHVERRGAEAMLRLSESRYQLLAEQSREMITLNDRDGTFLYVSPACRSLLGYEPEELVGTIGNALIHPDDVARYAAHVASAGSGSPDHAVLGRLRRRDGTWASTEACVTVVRDHATGEALAFQSVIRDDAGRAAAEASLRASEAALSRTMAMFQAVFGNAADGIVISDAAGRVVLMNPAAGRLFGCEPERAMGRRFATFFPENPMPTLKARRAELLAHPGTALPPAEVEGLHADGRRLPLEVACSSWRSGSELLVAHLIRDVAERHRLEAAKDEFVAMVSHELRTPLNTTALALDVLVSQGGPQLTCEQHKLLDIAHGNMVRLGRLVNDIIEFERLGLGRFSLTLRDVEAPELAAAAVELVAPGLRRRDVTLEVAVAPATLHTDPDRVVQVLTNLLGNAQKFTREGGAIGLVGRPAEDGMRFEVWDQGPGISPEDQARIFDAFQQGKPAGAAVHPGAGLGLAIARRIVAKLGGRLWLESEPGQGARFFVWLPAAL